MKRLDVAGFLFRRAIQQRRSLGDAADLALDAQSIFDPGTALASLVAEGLLTGINPPADGETPCQLSNKESCRT